MFEKLFRYNTNTSNKNETDIIKEISETNGQQNEDENNSPMDENDTTYESIFDDFVYENQSDDDIYEEDSEEDESENNNSINDDKESEYDESKEDESEYDDENLNTISFNHPSIQHIYSNRAYYYELEEKLQNSPLKIELKGDNVPIDYYLYMYIIVNNRDINPYIICLLEYNETMENYQFPKITYTPYYAKPKKDRAEYKRTEEEEEEEDNHAIEINNLCFSKLSSVFTINETDIHDNELFQEDDYLMNSILQHNFNNIIPIRSDSYVQYLKSNSNDNTVTNLSQYYSTSDKNKPPQYVWCSLDEIMRKKRVYNHTIHPDVYELFSKNKMYHTILDENHSTVEIPRMMYSCFIPKKKTEFITDKYSYSLLPIMSQYKNYGDMYFFSDDLLHIDDYQYIFKISRYIVFIGEIGITVKDDNNENNDTLITELNDNELIYNSVRFPYKINTVSGKKNTTIIGVVSSEFFYNF